MLVPIFKARLSFKNPSDAGYIFIAKCLGKICLFRRVGGASLIISNEHLSGTKKNWEIIFFCINNVTLFSLLLPYTNVLIYFCLINIHFFFIILTKLRLKMKQKMKKMMNFLIWIVLIIQWNVKLWLSLNGDDVRER